MNVLLVEDEQPALLKLKSILEKIDKNICILACLSTIKESVTWLQSNNNVDIIFLDIQLSDGISFEIFKSVNINVPVIFITAFDDYTLDAFKLNSIDYILKPYHKKEVEIAIDKYKKIYNKKEENFYHDLYKKLSKGLSQHYKKRFFARINKKVFSIHTNDILYFYFEDNATILVNNKNRIYVINYSLNKLEELLDPSKFFRINRKTIINISSITNINILSKSRIEIILSNNNKEIVSRAKTTDLKNWLGY